MSGRAQKAAESQREREARQSRDNSLALAIRSGKTDRDLLAMRYDLGEVRKMRKAMAEHDERERSRTDQLGLFDQKPETQG